MLKLSNNKSSKSISLYCLNSIRLQVVISVQASMHKTYDFRSSSTKQAHHYSQQIAPKDEQIHTLKNTINSLYTHNKELNQQKTTLETHIKQIVSQVSSYHSTMTQKTQQENAQLKQQIQSCRNSLQSNIKTITKLTQFVSKLQKTNSQLDNKSKQSQSALSLVQQQLKQAFSKIQQDEYQIKKLTQQKGFLTTHNQQLQRKCQNLEQQLNLIAQKYQQMVQMSGTTLKDRTIEINNREKYLKLEGKYTKSTKQTQKLTHSVTNYKKEVALLQFQNAGLRQELQDQRFEYKLEFSRLQMDITNLCSSIQLGQKIAEFESNLKGKFDLIFQNHNELRIQSELVKEQLELEERKCQQYESKLMFRESTIKQLEEERMIMKQFQRFKEEELETEYEARLTRLGFELKRQENQMADYQTLESELGQIKQEYEQMSSYQQHRLQASHQQISQLKQENEELRQIAIKTSDELDFYVKKFNQTDVFCEIVSNLLAVSHYMHCLILRMRERNRKLYMPFANYYFRIRAECDALTQSLVLKDYQKDHLFRKNQRLRKFRTCVQVVRAVIRMKKGSQQSQSYSTSYLRHSQKALRFKDGYRNNANKILQLIQLHDENNSGQFEQKNELIFTLLQFGNENCSANIANCMKLTLHQNDDVKKIRGLVDKIPVKDDQI